MYCIYEIAHIISIYCFNNRTNVQLSGPYGFLIWLSVFLCVGCFQRSGRHTGCTRTTEKTTWTQTWGHRSCNYLITYDSSLTFIVFYKCRYGIDIIATFLGVFFNNWMSRRRTWHQRRMFVLGRERTHSHQLTDSQRKISRNILPLRKR